MKGNKIKSSCKFNSEIAAAAKYYESKKKERKGEINYGGRNVGRGRKGRGRRKKGPCWGLKSLPLVLNFHLWQVRPLKIWGNSVHWFSSFSSDRHTYNQTANLHSNKVVNLKGCQIVSNIEGIFIMVTVLSGEGRPGYVYPSYFPCFNLQL